MWKTNENSDLKSLVFLPDLSHFMIFSDRFFTNVHSIKMHRNVLWEPRLYMQTDRHGKVNRHFLRLRTRLEVA